MSHEVGVPRLPEPTQQWSLSWMRDFIRVLTVWMQHMTAETHDEKAARYFPTVTVDTLLGPSFRSVLVDTSLGNIIITLPDPSTIIGEEFLVKRITAGFETVTVFVEGAAGDIEGLPSAAVAANECVRFKSDGTNYWIV
jgi:hypothetical protein